MLELWLWLQDSEPRVLAKKKHVSCLLFSKNLSNTSVLKGKDSNSATLGQHCITMMQVFEKFFEGMYCLLLQKLLSNIAFLEWSYETMANSCLGADVAHFVTEAEEGK